MLKRKISLALQGGGSLGALTWGVLDRLLEEAWIDIDAISGSSAGAMNAVALAHGWTQGGRDGARETLDALWGAVGGAAYPLPTLVDDAPPPVAFVPTPAGPSRFLLGLTRFFSPYQLNPLDVNPLRAIVERLFDFEQLRRQCPLRLFVGATHARSGALRLFRTDELTAEHLLASACLPTLNQAVTIDGEAYWDGGYGGNPALYPLVYECRSADLMIVMLMPMMRSDVPTTADAIRTRLTEIQFSATFTREMRSLAIARRYARGSLLRVGALERRLLGLRFHLVDADDLVTKLKVEESMNINLAFLLQLKREGRERAQAWLERHAHALGKRSSIDIEEMFANSPNFSTPVDRSPDA